MSLDKPEAIPVDTHVWQIARRDYAFRHPPSGSHKGSKAKCVLPERPKALSKGEYQAVGDHFRTLFGAYAGWAHSVLFIADLATNSPKKTPRVAKAVAKMATKSTKAPRPAAMLLPTRRSRRLNGITRMLET
ncbi:8-oxoguanine glycosylase ogg1 [Dimargaris xerosporica]|nr:8-oxoguanine glycosylase ogg1 [Dimargaris xerosporica]